LIDKLDPDANPNLDFVLTDTVRLIEQLCMKEERCFCNCVACRSRTRTVAALYGARKQGISGMLALQDVSGVLPDAWPNSHFLNATKRLGITRPMVKESGYGASGRLKMAVANQ
jgi:ADP-ribosyl-[dinitrogen reductase] hydrolase